MYFFKQSRVDNCYESIRAAHLTCSPHCIKLNKRNYCARRRRVTFWNEIRQSWRLGTTPYYEYSMKAIELGTSGR